MADSSQSSSSSSSSKLVYFVIFPFILLSGLLIILNQKPSSWLSSSSFVILNKGVDAPPPSAAPEVDQPPPMMENTDRKEFSDLDKASTPAAAPEVDQPPPMMENKDRKEFSDLKKASTPAAAPEVDQPPPMMENKDRKEFSDLEKVEASLARARATIQEARRNNETSYDSDYVPTGPMYRDPISFHRSYLEMENLFKIYVYEDGEPPLFHYSKSLGILGIEGILIHQLEISRFRTGDPRKAHVYFVPMSMQSISTYAYERNNRAWSPLQNIARDYVNLIATKYPYWNRTLGHDHFILACHDWGPTISHGIPYLYKNSIRVLCNANTSEGFKPSTDVSMPEIYLPDGTMDGLIGGPGPSKRSVLVFYAGGIHGDIRQALMDQWKDKDPDVRIHEYLPKKVSYHGMFRKSKYCICPSGWEVASPRMVEALYMGCVPVLLKNHYAKPFDDVLDWGTFSVDVGVNEIADLKKILTAIPAGKYVEMQRVGVLVRRHFEVNFPPKRFDVFHMILHSVWLRRINIQLNDAHET